MSKVKKDVGRDEAWMLENGFTLDADGKMMPQVNNPDGWRELAFAPIPKGWLSLVPANARKGLQVSDVPDCSIPLPSVKEEILRFMDEADIRTPEAAAKWRAVFLAANMDKCLLEGITDQLARRCTVRAILHLLVHFSSFVKVSEGNMSPEEVRKQIAEGRAENLAEHEKTRSVAVDAVLEKKRRGGQKREQEARVKEAMDRMAELISMSGDSPETVAGKVGREYRDEGTPLGITDKTLANRYREKRKPKPPPRS